MSNNLLPSSANYSTGTDQFLNNFYKPGYTVSGSRNDAVVAYFETINENKEAAKILASSVVYTSMAQGVDPIIILEQLKNMSTEDRERFLSMFLNFNRIGSSQLGIRSAKKYSSYIQRLISPPPSSFADGSSPDRAAKNARSIKRLTNEQRSGFYWIKGANELPIQVYCDMTGTEAGSTQGGWMRFDNALVHRYRNTGIAESTRGFAYNTSLDGAYNTRNPGNGQLRGIVWDLGPYVSLTGIRIKRVKFNCVGGQDGYYAYDGPQPQLGNPTDSMVVDFISGNYDLGSNFSSYGWAVGNGFPGSTNLIRVYKQAPTSEWPPQFTGLVTLTDLSFYQYDLTDLDTGRFLYYYESDSATEYNNLIDYTIWLR